MNKSMLTQAWELKSKLDTVQKELKNTTVEADSGKGAVKVTISGQQKVLSIQISPKIIDSSKPEYLEKLVLAAMNEAISKSQKLSGKQLKGLTGGLNIPGLT